jgi:hypothetical protein
VGRGTTSVLPALHPALKASPFGYASNPYPVTLCEQADGQDLPNLVFPFTPAQADLSEKPLVRNLALIEVPLQGTSHSVLVRLGLEADLDRLVSIPNRRLLLHDWTRTGLDDRHRHGFALLVKDLRHPDFTA